MSPLPFHPILLTDEERGLIELNAWNFYESTGRRMKVPTTLYEDLRNGGVDMRCIDPDPRLDTYGPPS